MKIAITAHRELQPIDYETIQIKMIDLVTNPDVEAIYFGGASGGDTEALEAALNIIYMHKPKLIVVLPNKLERQHPQTHAASRRADQLIELGLAITSKDYYSAYHRRDEYMVNNAECVVAFFDGIPKGGTHYTLEYGKKTNKTVEVVPILGRNGNGKS